MELDIYTKQLLANLLAKPVMVTQEHASMLTNLVKTYPYYQPLHLLLAKANSHTTINDNHLATAALYNGGNLLHQVIYEPATLNATSLKYNTIAPKVKLNTEQEIIEIEHTLADEQEVFEEINELNPITITTTATDEQSVFDEITEINVAPNNLVDEQETFDEIVEINSNDFPKPIATENFTDTTAVETLPAEFAIENIVNTDFFAFEKSFNTENTTQIVAQPEEYNLEAEAQTVSKYDDDKLPYTFLWWLAKTRKEHEQIFQPYVSAKKTNTPAAPNGELQQQYVEHIFHLQTPFNVADEANKGPLNKQNLSRGTSIIESFIKNDPQIKAPKAEQINNENKAKKSAEDNYDLVSETLAAIYIEQMLYHKAIDTYEKLSLKFPEKSRYFADLIQSLEKKI
jgi:hypothetical protein